jgi:cysteine desulfurase family protein (TIGR01976 family)
VARFDVDAVRARFSALDGSFAFFDAPGGTQVPDEVGFAIARTMREASGNTGAVYPTSRRIEALAGKARSAAARFVGADPDEIIFGQNMTALNFSLSRTLGRDLAAGDEIIVTRLDHDANVAPWLDLADDKGLVVRHVDVLTDTTLDLADLERKLGPRTKVVAFPWAANSVGTIVDAGRVVRLAHAAGALAWVDAVQYAPHLPIDVKAIDADVLVFSAYKLCGPHLGIAYGRRTLLETWRPYKARPAGTASVGSRFETGSLPFELLGGFVAAMEYLGSIGGLDAIANWERELGERFLGGLPETTAIYGLPRMTGRVPIFLLNLPDVGAPALAADLAAQNIGAWSGGNFYALGLYDRLAWGEALRIGISHYNTLQEVDQLTAALRRQAGVSSARPGPGRRSERLGRGDRFPVGLLPGDVVAPDGRLRQATVVYFYPKDGTPACSRQAAAFNSRAGEFEEAGLRLIGVSLDSEGTHLGFARELGLSFSLVSDENQRLSQAAGVLEDFGQHGVLAGRVTFLLDRAGIVREIWAVDDVVAHPREVLDAAMRLQPGAV